MNINILVLQLLELTRKGLFQKTIPKKKTNAEKNVNPTSIKDIVFLSYFFFYG